MRRTVLCVLCVLVLLTAGCASYYKLPAEDVEALEKLGAADLPRFAERTRSSAVDYTAIWLEA